MKNLKHVFRGELIWRERTFSSTSTMKFNAQKALSTLCVVLPLFLFGNGCENKNDKISETSASSADTNSATANADNSGKNARDNNSATLTAGDQSNSEPDRKITQQIRQQVVSGTNHYSLTARNIKIVTDNGKVTLRGPVNSEAEKSGIEGIAKNVAGEGHVDDELEVKANANQ